MADIKIRDTVPRTIKAIDKSAVVAERMKDAFIRTKEEMQCGTSTTEGNPEEYATDKVTGHAETAAAHTARAFDKQGQKAVRQSVRAKTRPSFDSEPPTFTETPQPETAGAQFKRAEQKRMLLRTQRSSGETIKTSVREKRTRSIKTADRAVKPVERSVRTVRRTARTIPANPGVTVKTANASARRAKAAARNSVEVVKKAAAAASKAIRAILAATKALVNAILAGSWIVITIVLVVVLLGAALSLFGSESGRTSYLQPLMKYYHNGVFSVDFKHIPESRVQVLRTTLTEDFYFISEIKDIYSRLFPEADAEEINPYSLNGLGFTVLSKYAIQHFDSAADYFHQLLTKDDIYSLKPLRERYGKIMMFSQTLFDLRREYEIFLFGDEQIVTMRRLSRFGITKDDIYSYCDAVAAATEDGEYFTVYSLRQKGVESKLDDLGFDDLFYAWILAMHPDFAYQRVFRSIILLKTNESAFTSTRDFLRWLLSDYDSVDADDFISDCQENYGIAIPNRSEITEAISGTDMYYDPIMGRIYSDKSIYYDELSDEPDDE